MVCYHDYHTLPVRFSAEYRSPLAYLLPYRPTQSTP
jgi:hypothetical protein